MFLYFIAKGCSKNIMQIHTFVVYVQKRSLRTKWLYKAHSAPDRIVLQM